MANSRICSVEGCGKPHVSKGFCGAHYMRRKRHGDPSRGGTPHGEPERFYQEVVLVYEGEDCLVWPYKTAGKGYGVLGEKYVHRRLCKETHGPAPTPAHEVAHSCGRGFDACVTKSHLSWKTHAQNEADKMAHGTRRLGENVNFAKLTQREVREIRALKGKKFQREIAAQFGVAQTLVSQIHRRKVWAWLD